MKRKLLVGVAVLALAGMSVGALWAGSASADDKRRTFTRVLSLADAEIAEIDEGDEGPSLGDELIVSGPLTNRSGNTVLGRLDVSCVTTSAPGPSAELRQLCVSTASALGAPGPEIEMQGVGRLEAEDVDAAITGGTGIYREADGFATFDFSTEGKVVITFHVIF